MTSHSFISLQNVGKSFGPKMVLQNLTLDVQKGESLVVIGGSGTGKSVMLKCILGLLKADSGSIKVDGKEMIDGTHADIEDIRRHTSMLFQGSALFDSLTVWENIAFTLLQSSALTKTEAHQRAIDKLAAVGLPAEVAQLYPAELSGGMQRRVALARAVISKPEILFFDEPTTGLDPIMAGLINDLIRSQVKELGATAITITHDMESAKHIADRIAMIYQGKIVWQGTVHDIEQSGNAYVDQFIRGSTQGPIAIEGK